jgi:hypothetical protein
MEVAMLTTSDNPFSPFDEFKAWFAFDAAAGYHTPGYLARITVSSEDLSDVDRNLANTQAIDEIVAENINGMYVKVTRTIPDVEVTVEV